MTLKTDMESEGKAIFESIWEERLGASFKLSHTQRRTTDTPVCKAYRYNRLSVRNVTYLDLTTQNPVRKLSQAT